MDMQDPLGKCYIANVYGTVRAVKLLADGAERLGFSETEFAERIAVSLDAVFS
jgi:hypothetical protein